MCIAATISRRSCAIGWRRAIISDRPVLDLALELVDAAVDDDDALGQLGVAAGERGDRVGDLLLGEAAHLGDLLRELAQLLVEGGDDVFLHGHLTFRSQPKRPVM